MRCKAGELAFIRKSMRTTNIGRVVTCKEMLGYFIQGESFLYNGESWMAHETDYMWVVSGNIETLFGNSAEALVPDSWMTPIRPEPVETTEHTRELDHAE